MRHIAANRHRRITAVILLLLFVCTVSAIAQKRQLFHGTVVGHDGKPMKDAHVELWRFDWGNRFAGRESVSVGPNGNFLTKLYPGLYEIQFAGVDHEFSPRRFIFIDSTLNCSVHAQLARSRFLPLRDIDTVFVEYIDPTGEQGRLMRPMQDLGDGHFEAQLTLPGTSHPLWRLYDMPPALIYHIAGIVPERLVNGTDQDYYTYDEGGDFFSVKRIEDSIVTLRFDYHALTAIDRDVDGAEFRFHIEGTPLHHPYAMLIRRKQAYRDLTLSAARVYADSGSAEWQDYIAQGYEPHSRSDTAGRFAERLRLVRQQADSASAYLAELRHAGDRMTTERRESLLLLYLNAVKVYKLRRNETSLHESAAEVKRWVRHALDTIAPTSPIWSVAHNALPIFRALGNETFYEYALRVMRENPSSVARFYAFDQMKSTMRLDTSAGSRERLEALHREATQLLAGTDAEDEIARADADPLAEARKHVEEMRRLRSFNQTAYEQQPEDSTVVGKPLPAFRFLDYRDSSIVYSNDVLRGHPYVFCLAYVTAYEYVCLEDLLARYADRGLRVIMPAAIRYHRTVNDTSQTITRSFVRLDRTTLPWPPLLADTEELQRLHEELKVLGPGHYLVDPDGIIVAAGLNMFELHIEVTVEKYFEGKLE